MTLRSQLQSKHVEFRLAPATVFMALVAVRAVVDVALHSLMILVGLRLGVAVRAREDGEVIRVCMAGAANAVRIAVVQREIGVIEIGIRPLHGVVTRRACGWEMRGRVVRIIRVQVIRLVAAVAIRRQRRVVAIDVAVHADSRRHHVRAGQRESRFAVIEHCVRPLNGVVTDFARLREFRRHVIRILGAVEVRKVASYARGIVQLVIVVDVAV